MSIGERCFTSPRIDARFFTTRFRASWLADGPRRVLNGD
jgi:hypothetical protein